MQAAPSLSLGSAGSAHAVPPTFDDAPARRRRLDPRVPAAHTGLLQPPGVQDAWRVFAVVAAAVVLTAAAVSLQLRALAREQSSLNAVRAQRSELDATLGAQVRQVQEEVALLEADTSRMRLQWDPALSGLQRHLQQDALDVACNAGRDRTDLDSALAGFAAERPEAAELAALPGWQGTLNMPALSATWERCRGLR